jgi:CRISPR-associated protein Cas5t
MIAVEVQAPFANFRKSFARSFAESYTLPPPATVYGMLLSLVGERRRRTHVGAKLALGLRRTPRLTTVLKKLSRYKYGVPGKQAELGNAPDYMEVVCGLDFVIFVDSIGDVGKPSLEHRISVALDNPERVERSGILCLGLSDDLVDGVRRYSPEAGRPPAQWLVENTAGPTELTVWVDHVGAADTRWRRFSLVERQSALPPEDAWLVMRAPDEP